jgi:hypothetical protein
MESLILGALFALLIGLLTGDIPPFWKDDKEYKGPRWQG